MNYNLRFFLFAAPVLNCNDIKKLRQALTGITVDQINAIESTEFTDCIDVLGEVPNFQQDQRQALSAKAIAVRVIFFIKTPVRTPGV